MLAIMVLLTILWAGFISVTLIGLAMAGAITKICIAQNQLLVEEICALLTGSF